MGYRRIGLSWSLAIGALVSACGGSSTAPGPTATQMMAASLDTQAVNAATAGQFDRFRLLAYPIAAMSENLAPASVSLTVDGTATPYQALGVEVVGTTTGTSNQIAPSDSFFVVAAWTGATVSELVYSDVLLPDTVVDFADLSDTVANFNLAQAPTTTVTLGSMSGGCGSYTLPDVNTAVQSLLESAKCSSGTATVAFSFDYVANPPKNPHSTFVLSSQQIPAVRIVLPASTGGQQRMRQLLARARRRVAP